MASRAPKRFQVHFEKTFRESSGLPDPWRIELWRQNHAPLQLVRQGGRSKYHDPARIPDSHFNAGI